jgi:glycosyltransferase involved in cell wall biosynthesis
MASFIRGNVRFTPPPRSSVAEESDQSEWSDWSDKSDLHLAPPPLLRALPGIIQTAMPDSTARRFVVATPFRTVCDDNARALERHGLLRLLAMGTRRGTAGVPPERTRLLPAWGLANYIFARTLSTSRAESLRFAMHPWLDAWVKRQLQPGDHLISSYGYVNASFAWARRHGGQTFLDGGNSHPLYARAILEEEHRRWGWKAPWTPHHHFRRSLEMMDEVDYVLSPSSFVTRSFLEHGFRPEQILRNVYPLDLSLFTPAPEPRPPGRPLTLISTGSLSLRKGTPYLLEAFRLVRQAVPDARLLLNRIVADNAQPIIEKYRDLPIEWAPALPHAQLVERLRSADLYILPSLEEGLARSITEALACGLPAIVTPNTGVADYISEGVNGSVVPIRDPQAIADAILAWRPRILARTEPPVPLIDRERFSFATFEREFIAQLKALGLAPADV